MNTCQTYQTQLLDHLYGLLDEPDQAALTAHLEGCAVCRAALDTAHAQQQAIVLAARGSFPSVRFEPPADVQPIWTGKEPATAARPSPRRWVRWGVAAGLLLGFTGLGTVAGTHWAEYASAVAESRAAEERASQARVQLTRQRERERQQERIEIADIQKQILLLEAKWNGASQEIERAYRDRDVQVTVTGPKTVQAGAPNTYRINVQRQRPAVRGKATKLTARLLDPQTGTELARLPVGEGSTPWNLPQDLPVKPGAQLTLVVSEESDSAAVRAVASALDPLGLAPFQAVAAHVAGAVDRTHVKESLPLVSALFATHLTTDRPMYRPGETVRFRSLTLQRFSLEPAQEDFQLIFQIIDPRGGEMFKLQGAARVKDADGKRIAGPDGKPICGVGAGEFRIPPDAPGGEYTLRVSEASKRFPEQERKFLVNKYQAPRLNKEVEFTRKSYGPGDAVEARCKVARVEGGGIIDNEPVSVTAHVDGQPCAVLDAGALQVRKGEVTVRVQLPNQIHRGEAILAVQFFDGGTTETIVRPIPVALRKLNVEFFPEGGEMIAGLPCRVYFTARTTLGKPAELRGRLVDKAGKVVATVQTLNDDTEAGVNQGMGVFAFAPQAGNHYQVKIDAPVGIEGEYRLPQVKPAGVVLTIPAGVFTDQIEAVVSSTAARRLLVGAYCRGRLLDHLAVEVKANQPTPVKLAPAHGASGVYRVTVFEERAGQQLVPLAERLVYRRPVEQLRLEVQADRDSYAPGDKVTLTLRGTDEKRRAAPAVVLLSAVDLGIIKLADEKTARSMPTHFYLTTEVRRPEELEYADFLVTPRPEIPSGLLSAVGAVCADPAHGLLSALDLRVRVAHDRAAKAAAALDLLLGTQGWRRFAEQKPGEFRQRHLQEADRLLLASGQAGQEQKNFKELRQLAIDREFAPQHVVLQKRLAAREVGSEQLEKQRGENLGRLQQEVAQAQAATATRTEQLEAYRGWVVQWVLIGAALVLVALTVLGFAVGMTRLARGLPRAVPYYATGICSLLLLMLGGLVTAVVFLRAPVPAGFEVAAAREDGVVMQDKAAPDMAKAEMAPGMEKLDWGRPVPKGVMDKDVAVPGDMAKKEMPPVAAFQPPPLKKKQLLGLAPDGKRLAVGDDRGVRVWDADKGKKEAMAPAAPGGPMGRPVADNGRAPMPIPAPQPPFPGMGGGMPGEGRFGWQRQADEPVAGPGEPGFFDHQRQLRREGKFVQIIRERMNLDRQQFRARALPALLEPLLVREYAHQHQPAADGLRRDFAETVYWHPVLVVPGGKEAVVRFDLPDSVTRFQVVAWGHTLNGRLGATTTEIASRLPFSVEPKVPIEVTRSDKITIPVIVANDTAKTRSVDLEAQATGLTVVGDAKKQLAVDAGKRVRQLFQFRPSLLEGDATLRFLARSDLGGDRVERGFKVVPEGFPIVGSHSDVLEKVLTHDIVLPERWVPGTLKVQAEVFPSTLADLQKGLEAMLNEPCGCFEQSSSSNYPNVMILSYLKETEQANPQVEQRARALLRSGYQKLTAFECIPPQQRDTRRGYEWFGQTAPPHEALTAYGLLQFMDMKRVGHPVDEAMLERTKQYLLGQRDGRGGFRRNPQALDSFGRAPDHITTAYIVWALTEAGVPENLDVELKALHAQAKGTKDPYFASLVAISHLNRGKTDEALELLRAVRATQQKDGRVTGATTSITGSSGQCLEIESTALAMLGWLKANRPGDFNANVQNAAKWLGTQRGGFGGYGSTQSTILALKALIAFTNENKKIAEAADLVLFVNGKEAGRKHLAAGAREGLLVSLADASVLQPGKNTVRVEMTRNTFPCTLTWSYRTLKPANPDGCPVQLSTKLNVVKAAEGETVTLTARVKNTTAKGQGMTVAIIGLPSGLTVPEDFRQLKDMAKVPEDGSRPKIGAFELRGRELVLYWRDLAPHQEIAVNLDLICRIPGEYRGPASRSYLYYNTDRKFWVEPLTVSIAPQAQ